MLNEVWYWSSQITIKKTQIKNVFEIKFSSPSDIDYAMNEAPWEISKFLLILRRWKVGKTFEKIDFKHENFWM